MLKCFSRECELGFLRRRGNDGPPKTAGGALAAFPVVRFDAASAQLSTLSQRLPTMSRSGSGQQQIGVVWFEAARLDHSMSFEDMSSAHPTSVPQYSSKAAVSLQYICVWRCCCVGVRQARAAVLASQRRCGRRARLCFRRCQQSNS